MKFAFSVLGKITASAKIRSPKLSYLSPCNFLSVVISPVFTTKIAPSSLPWILVRALFHIFSPRVLSHKLSPRVVFHKFSSIASLPYLMGLQNPHGTHPPSFSHTDPQSTPLPPCCPHITHHDTVTFLPPPIPHAPPSCSHSHNTFHLSPHHISLQFPYNFVSHPIKLCHPIKLSQKSSGTSGPMNFPCCPSLPRPYFMGLRSPARSLLRPPGSIIMGFYSPSNFLFVDDPLVMVV